MPTNRELTQAVAKEFKLSEKRAATFLKKKQINPYATAAPKNQIKPQKLKQILRKIPPAIKWAGLKVRNLGKRDDILRQEIKQKLEKFDQKFEDLAKTEFERKGDNKESRRGLHESGIDYLDRIRGRQTEKEERKETALTSGSALARQEAKPPAEARPERQTVRPMHVELAPGIENIEAARGGEGEPLAPDIG